MDMKKIHLITLVGLLIGSWSFGQKMSKADQHFFEYNYNAAIEAYELEAVENELTVQQRLNLAESFYKTQNLEKAATLYLELYKSNSAISGRDFNLMLQALSRTSNPALTDGSIDLRAGSLSEELIDNAAFNFELLQGNLSPMQDFEVRPIGSNSPFDDFAPSFFDLDRLLFTSNRSGTDKEVYLASGNSYSDLMVGRVSTNGDVIQVNNLPWLPELRYHEATPYYSSALGSLFYVRSNTNNRGEMVFDENGKNTLAICLADSDGGFMELLSSPGTSFYYPFYDEKTERLYFAADFPQGYGGTDLYYVMTSKGKIMSSPINLGPKINTPGNEISPFIFEEDFYFASDVFYGLGGMDIYKSQIGSGQLFSTPTNLGPGFNSASDDFGFILRINQYGDYEGYFASNRSEGQGGDDIYYFSIDETPGLRTLMAQGTTLDSDTEFALPDAYVQFVNKDNEVLRETRSKQDGSFRIEIPYKENVRLVISKEHFSRVVFREGEGDMILTSGQPIRVFLDPVETVVQQLRGQNVLNLDKFYFERGSSRLTPEVSMILDKAANVLNDFPHFKIRIEAHTDSQGSSADNAEVSELRALVIRDYLINHGVSEERILDARGFGEGQIINHCVDGVFCLDVLHRQNERYPIIVDNYE